MRVLEQEIQKRTPRLQPKHPRPHHNQMHERAIAMHGADGQMNGWFSGLKKRIRIKDVGKFAKKNINLKTGIKVAQIAAPLASTLVPVGGGLINKLAGTKVGNLVQKVTTGKAAQFITKAANTKVGQVLVKAGTPLVKTAAGNIKSQLLNGAPKSIEDTQATEQVPGTPNEAQQETLQQLKGAPNEAQQETLNALKGVQDGKTEDTGKNNTLLYAGIAGAVLLGAAYANKQEPKAA